MNILSLVKLIVSSLLIFFISEISKKFPKIGALIASLPLVSIISIVWIFYETKDKQKIIDFCNSIYIYIFPSLFIFIFLPIFLKSNLSFILSLILSIIICVLVYILIFIILNKKIF